MAKPYIASDVQQIRRSSGQLAKKMVSLHYWRWCPWYGMNAWFMKVAVRPRSKCLCCLPASLSTSRIPFADSLWWFEIRLDSDPEKTMNKLECRRSTDSATCNNGKVYLDLCSICTFSNYRLRLVHISFTLLNVTQQANRIRKLMFMFSNDTIRYDSVYLRCSKKLMGSQLSLPHGTNKKIKMWN